MIGKPKRSVRHLLAPAAAAFPSCIDFGREVCCSTDAACAAPVKFLTATRPLLRVDAFPKPGPWANYCELGQQPRRQWGEITSPREFHGVQS